MSTEAQDRKAALKRRTMAFALAALSIYRGLPASDIKSVYGKQLLRCSASVGANYRAACRARSTPDFINKLKIVEEEADESLYWLELMVLAGVVEESAVAPLIHEGTAILAQIVTSIRTLRSRAAVVDSGAKAQGGPS